MNYRISQRERVKQHSGFSGICVALRMQKKRSNGQLGTIEHFQETAGLENSYHLRSYDTQLQVIIRVKDLPVIAKMQLSNFMTTINIINLNPLALIPQSSGNLFLHNLASHAKFFPRSVTQLSYPKVVSHYNPNYTENQILNP